MAHFIKLHTAGQNQEILFNLDTVVSIEPYGEHSTIMTRWSHQNVKESLDEIQKLAREYIQRIQIHNKYNNKMNINNNIKIINKIVKKVRDLNIFKYTVSSRILP